MKSARLKFLIFGDDKSGKNALRNRFVGDYFTTSLTPSICGANFLIKNKKEQGIDIKFEIWLWPRYIDPDLFYAHVCMITVDLTVSESLQNVTKWLTFIAKKCRNPKPEIILVGTKADYVSDREISDAEIEDYSKLHNVSYYITSAKNSIQVDEAFLSPALKLISEFKEAEEKEAEANKHKIAYKNAIDKLNNILTKLKTAKPMLDAKLNCECIKLIETSRELIKQAQLINKTTDHDYSLLFSIIDATSNLLTAKSKIELDRMLNDYNFLMNEAVGKPSKLWRTLAAIMSSIGSIALTVTGILISIGLFGAGSPLGLTFIAGGTSLVASGSAAYFAKGRRKYMSKTMDSILNQIINHSPGIRH